jgi:hypothetical protein
MNKFLKQLTTVLRYGHDDFNSILKQMTYHDFAGDEHGDHIKRGVLADAYEEVTGDTEGANLLRKEGEVVAYHKGKIHPAVIKEFTAFHPTWSEEESNGLDHQQFVEKGIKFDENKQFLYVGLHRFNKDNIGHIDTNKRGYKVYVSPFTGDRRVDKMITVPIHLDSKNMYYPKTGDFQ